MKKILLFALCITLISVFSWAGGERESVPRVRYIEPKNDHTVDLTGKKSLVFKWKSSPTPSGGRRAYRFTVYKGFGYERVISENLDHKIYSREVPAELFEDGKLYTWQVKQRDGRTHVWSMDSRWSFKVKK